MARTTFPTSAIASDKDLSELSDDSSLILLGSADASDHTDVFLTEIYNFDQSARRNIEEKNLFLFYKKHLKKKEYS